MFLKYALKYSYYLSVCASDYTVFAQSYPHLFFSHPSLCLCKLMLISTECFVHEVSSIFVQLRCAKKIKCPVINAVNHLIIPR